MKCHDKFGNTATIKTKYMKAYKDAPTKDFAYVLTLTNDWDNDFVYFVSVYETEEEALKKLSEFSCGTFK